MSRQILLMPISWLRQSFLSLRAGRRISDLKLALLLGLLAFVVFNANGRTISASDTYAARYLPFSIVQHGKLTLNAIADQVLQGRKPAFLDPRAGTGFWVLKGTGSHLVSLYPIIVPALISPFYALPSIWLTQRQGDPLLADMLAHVLEKLTASAITAASVALMFLLLRRLSRRADAAALTFLYAFGTTTWVISSQALWQHGLAELLITATLWLITGPTTRTRATLVGLFCALIAANRQPDTVFAAAMGFFALRWAGRQRLVLIFAGLATVALVVTYNLVFVGNLAGGYGQFADSSHLSRDPLSALGGLLVSPTRGLFVFSPFLILVPMLIWRSLRSPSKTGWLPIALAVAVIAQLVGYCFVDWRQGMSWGPRWLTDMLPILVWLLSLAMVSTSGRLRSRLTIVLVMLGGLSIGLQTIGAFWYTGASDAALAAISSRDNMAAYWDVSKASFLAELRHPPATADLFTSLRGTIDAATVSTVLTHTAGGDVSLSQEAEIAGWVLADGHAPTGVAVWVNGREMGGTGEIVFRPDVAAALITDQPSGFSVRFPVSTLVPGTYDATVLVRPYAGSEPRRLGKIALIIPPNPALTDTATILAEAVPAVTGTLAQRLQPPGYWLTRHTKITSYTDKQTEMNVFLNAVMLDVLSPIAEQTKLLPTLDRARDFLSTQIETSGLVRFHGLPTSSSIGRLGCVITPDSDDTALAWRLAPRSTPGLLSKALDTIAAYRRSDGLYKTWLAPQQDYQCIDPGKDYDPADIGIQIHLLMWFATADPAAAHALCRALSSRLDDESLWVYYKVAPPIIALRLPEMERLGCPLAVPPDRLKTPFPAQQIWMDLIGLMATPNATSSGPSHQRATDILAQLAADHFAAVSTNPPLIYNNDLSAHVRRYYWSEELGFALWLRLYWQTFPPVVPDNCSGQMTCTSR